MLRITRITESSSLVTLKLEGRIVSDWVSLLQKEILCLLRHGRTVELDCSGVIFADEDGLVLLKQIAGKNLKIVNSSPLIKGLLGDTL
jgi:anti-anti-sigma regulatory factor